MLLLDEVDHGRHDGIDVGNLRQLVQIWSYELTVQEALRVLLHLLQVGILLGLDFLLVKTLDELVIKGFHLLGDWDILHLIVFGNCLMSDQSLFLCL